MSWNGEGKALLAINLSLCISWTNTSPSLKAVGSSESLLTLYLRDYKVIKMSIKVDVLLKIR